MILYRIVEPGYEAFVQPAGSQSDIRRPLQSPTTPGGPPTPVNTGAVTPSSPGGGWANQKSFRTFDRPGVDAGSPRHSFGGGPTIAAERALNGGQLAWRGKGHQSRDRVESCQDVDLRDLITRLLDPEPKTRLTAKQALQHRYFEKNAMPQDVPPSPQGSPKKYTMGADQIGHLNRSIRAATEQVASISVSGLRERTQARENTVTPSREITTFGGRAETHLPATGNSGLHKVPGD